MNVLVTRGAGRSAWLAPVMCSIGLILPVLGLFGCGSGLMGEPAPSTTPSSAGSAGDDTLPIHLDTIRGRYRLPALTAMSFRTDGIVESGAIGVRALGHPEAVTVGDQWHVGSLTKSMTATLAAMLVEQGLIAWDTTLGQTFAGTSMRSEYDSVRLEELLTHTAGIATDMTQLPSWSKLRDSTRSLPEQRRQIVAETLAMRGPARGTYAYSNLGYILAGAMLEKVSGEAWEDLIARRLFAPLGMSHTGFGAPGSAGVRDQPWGHRTRGSGFEPLAPGPDADNPLAIGPAGTVHSTLADLALYYRMQLNGARGVSSLVSVASFDKLQRPAAGSEYASGWGVVNRDWAGGRALNHSGSNTFSYAVIWLAPTRGFGVFAATNGAGDEAAQRATDDAVVLLIERLQGRPPTS